MLATFFTFLTFFFIFPRTFFTSMVCTVLIGLQSVTDTQTDRPGHN